MKTSMFLPFAAVAAIACLHTAPAAAKSVAVEYRDLDLTSEKGRKQLDRRINKAARQVCGVDEVTTGSRLKALSLQCYRKAKKDAAVQVASVIESRSLGG